jgi:hypothetical protein
VEKTSFSYFMWRGDKLFTLDVERSHSSHSVLRGVALM